MDSEKPIECTGCKKKATVTYRDIKDGKMATTNFCADCPILRDKLATNIGKGELIPVDVEKNVVCPECKTTLYAVMTGAPFGCKKCYDTFEEFLTHELTQSGAIPLSTTSKVEPQNKLPLHLGNVPSGAKCPDFSDKLRSLNSALHEALAIENYERAANLRDQIKIMMDRSYKGVSD